LGLHDFSLKCDHKTLDLTKRLHLQKLLGDIKGQLETADCTVDRCDVHCQTPENEKATQPKWQIGANPRTQTPSQFGESMATAVASDQNGGGR
jgi:hypothetical protein